MNLTGEVNVPDHSLARGEEQKTYIGLATIEFRIFTVSFATHLRLLQYTKLFSLMLIFKFVSHPKRMAEAEDV